VSIAFANKMLGRFIRPSFRIAPRISKELSLFSFSTDAHIIGSPSHIGLHNISDNKGARRKRKIVGRGPGSGLGKTCGRGHKGQKSRGSMGKPFFEGGQTPLHRKLPKRGFKNVNKIRYEPVNCSLLVERIKQGRIDPKQKITIKHMFDAGLINGVKHGVKLLGKGIEELTSLDTPLTIEVSHASKEAKKAIEELGGEVTYRYFNRRALRAHLKPHKFHPNLMPGPSIPPPRLQERYLPFMEEELLAYYKHLVPGDGSQGENLDRVSES